MTVPCKGCGDRSATCHAECEKYLEYAAWRKEIREKRSREREVKSHITDSVAKAKRSSKAWKGKA